MTQPETWVVLKFGGTSVSSLSRWQTIKAVAERRLQAGLRPLVVCSAIRGVSDLLDKLVDLAPRGDYQGILRDIRGLHERLATELGIDLGHVLGADFEGLERTALGISLLGEASPRIRARVMAQGEIMLTRLAVAWLNLNQSTPVAHWLDARECLLSNDDPRWPEARRYLSASCGSDKNAELSARLLCRPEPILVTQGFFAKNAVGDTVLLGRGGSDTSAAYFAALLGASSCEIWTDVPGMYTANPRWIPQARLLLSLGYDEAQEIASAGARVLHPRCIQPVRDAGIPLCIRCTTHPDHVGTKVNGGQDEGAGLKAIASKRGLTLVSMESMGMWRQVGFLADAFAVFKRHGLSIDLVSTSETTVVVSLDPAVNTLDQETMSALIEDLGAFCRTEVIGPCASVSLVGRKVRAILHKLGPVLGVFEEQRIHLVSQAANDLNLTFVVDEQEADRLGTLLHEQLLLEWQGAENLGPAWEETFAPKALPEPHSVHAWWARRQSELLALAQHGTPVYAYDPNSVLDAAARLRGLSAVDRVFYAIKANPNPAVLKLLFAAGLGFECVSPGEVAHVRALFPDLPRERLLFTPNFAPAEEYAQGFAQNAMVTLDNIFPLRTWPEIFAGKEIMVRLDPGRGRGHHSHVQTAGVHSKFGVSPSEQDELRALCERHRVKVFGLHAHVGSGIFDAGTWSEVAVFLNDLADQWPDVRVLDIGGGLGVPEKPQQAGLDLAVLDASLADVRAAHPKRVLWLEPGRYLVAAAGVLLARVTQIKQKAGLSFVGIDAGMNSLIRPALYGAYHEIANLSRISEPRTMTANIVGPICESGDTLGYARHLAPAQAGDVILIANTGAYGYAMSSHYNLREPAREVMLEARGTMG